MEEKKFYGYIATEQANGRLVIEGKYHWPRSKWVDEIHKREKAGLKVFRLVEEGIEA